MGFMSTPIFKFLIKYKWISLKGFDKMENQIVLNLNNVNKSFYTINGELEVVKDLSFTLKEGEIVGIVGPSGAGKSTILNLIAGLIKPTSGEIQVDGEIGYMFQKDHLLEWRDIYHNVVLGVEVKKQLTKENIDRAHSLLEKYGLKDFKDCYPKELSGGMRQRIALIRTLLTNPKVLLLDEAFSALDYQTRLMVSCDVYKMIRGEKIASIIVTHDLTEAISLCDKVIVLTKRPAQIINVHDLEFDKNLSPIEKRTDTLFQMYFDKIWRELNE